MILLSHIIDSETPTYGNRDRVIIEEISRISDGASANSSKWTFTSNHFGTHIDMPKHFFENGKSVTDVRIDFWFSNKIQLIEVTCSEAKLIDMSDLPVEINLLTEVLLIRTGYEEYRKTDKYWDDNPGLSPTLGKWLRKNRPNIKIVGFDFISLTSWKYRDEGKKAHKIFLNPESENYSISIIEDMKLGEVNESIKTLLISPLMINKGNGTPVTIFANI